jgi:hypothetical protein
MGICFESWRLSFTHFDDDSGNVSVIFPLASPNFDDSPQFWKRENGNSKSDDTYSFGRVYIKDTGLEWNGTHFS